MGGGGEVTHFQTPLLTSPIINRPRDDSPPAIHVSQIPPQNGSGRRECELNTKRPIRSHDSHMTPLVTIIGHMTES